MSLTTRERGLIHGGRRGLYLGGLIFGWKNALLILGAYIWESVYTGGLIYGILQYTYFFTRLAFLKLGIIDVLEKETFFPTLNKFTSHYIALRALRGCVSSCLCLLHVSLFLRALRAFIFLRAGRALFYLRALRFLPTFIFHVPYEPSFITYLTCLRLFTCLICLQFFTCLRDFIFNITYMSPFFLCLTSFGLMFLHFLLALRPFIYFCVLRTFSLYFWRALRAFTWNYEIWNNSEPTAKSRNIQERGRLNGKQPTQAKTTSGSIGELPLSKYLLEYFLVTLFCKRF